MAWISVTRLKSILAAALAVGFALALVDVALEAMLGPAPSWLPAPFDWGFISQFGGRLAAVEQLESIGVFRPDRTVAVLGMSTVREDLDARVLHNADPAEHQWIILGGSGGSFAELENYAQVFVGSPVKPPLVALGIHEVMLYGFERAPENASMREFLVDVLHHHPRQALAVGSWLYRNRDAIQDEATLLNFRAQQSLRVTFALPMSAVFAPEDNPWSVWTHYQGDHMDASDLADLYKARVTSLAPSSLVVADRQVSALGRIIAALRNRGESVAIILMPDHSKIRALYSPDLDRAFRQALAQISPAASLPVIDLRDSMPDDLFFDYWHLNPQGRREFSAKLPALLP